MLPSRDCSNHDLSLFIVEDFRAVKYVAAVVGIEKSDFPTSTTFFT